MVWLFYLAWWRQSVQFLECFRFLLLSVIYIKSCSPVIVTSHVCVVFQFQSFVQYRCKLGKKTVEEIDTLRSNSKVRLFSLITSVTETSSVRCLLFILAHNKVDWKYLLSLVWLQNILVAAWLWLCLCLADKMSINISNLSSNLLMIHGNFVCDTPAYMSLLRILKLTLFGVQELRTEIEQT